MWVATAARCKEVDRIAREERGISTATLMESAGQAVFEAVDRITIQKESITVLCGKGNNGGDGLVVARLARKAGYEVQCLITAERHELSPDAQARLEEALEADVSVVFPSDPDWRTCLDELVYSEVIVDALLGIGIRGEVNGTIRECIEATQDAIAKIVAVDVPSGIDTDTGEICGVAIQASYTVTFGMAKPFLFQGDGQEYAGQWEVATIGLPDDLIETPTDAFMVSSLDIEWKLPKRTITSHKGQNGSLLIVAGSDRYPGAATLATMGAIRAGAGLVTVAASPEVCRIVAHHVPEAIFLPLPDEDPAEAILAEMDRFDAAVFGPGKTTEPDILDFWSELWPRWTKPCVLDADALNAISKGIQPPKGPLALTPHPGEMSRLLGWTSQDVRSRRLEAVRALAHKVQGAVLLKGAHTLISEPNEQVLRINPTGNPGMAVAGMGDVLSGVVGTLLAQGLSCIDALMCGAFWHGYAGDCLSRMTGYTASDLARELPHARAILP